MRKTTRKLLLCVLMTLIIGVAIATPMGYGERGREILIIRDNFGVPHIFANTKERLAFGAGYAMAQDRLWQADVFRRTAFGSLAEFGLASIDADYATRSLAYSREELRQIFNTWVPIDSKARLKEMWSAYVDGVNLYISQAQEALARGDPSLIPVEYLAYGLLPIEPWTIEDSAAITVMMAWRFGGAGGDELSYAAALQAFQTMHGNEVGWAIFNDIFPQVDPGAEVTIPSENSLQWSSSMPTTPFLSNIADINQKYEESQMRQTQLMESLGLPMKFGSNAWVVSPWKSETKNTLQVGGPQMGHSIPQIVLEIGLHGAGIDAVGMMMPMGPSILIGVSQQGAWTSTSGISDVFDIYVEVLNPLNPTQYLYNGAWRDMEKRTERIYGYKKQFYEDKDIYRTIHGPIIAWDIANNHAYTMKATFYKNELAAEEGWSLFQQAKNIWDFQEAVKTIMPSHNFYWIDRDGNIGYWHAGQYPIKPKFGVGGRPIDDRLPLMGTGEEEWVGITGFDEMPKSINPEQGWLANWNNKPISDWPFAESEAYWGEGHRVKWIQELLAAGYMFTFEDMNAVNREAAYNHIEGMNFLHYLVEAAKTDPTVPTEVTAYLEAWNHHYNDVIEPRWPSISATYDDPGLTIFEKWYGKILNEVFADDLGPISAASSTLIHVFDGPDSKLPLNYDYLNGEERDVVIVRELKEALVDLEGIHGPDMSKWLTPVRKITFSRMGALPAPTMHSMNRGTYNHIAEMPRGGKPPRAVDVIPPGQSGFMNYLGQYNHAYDQLPLYESWQYKPMLFSYGDIKAVAESTTTLLYQ